MMDFLGTLFLIVILATIVLAVFLIQNYNSIQAKAQLIKEAKSNILVMLKKRKLLIERLADVVKAYAGHEKDILLNVSKDQTLGEENLSKTYRDTSALFANLQTLAQRFPNIKADAQYARHMNDITAIETELQNKRELYNSNVKQYNTDKRRVPIVFFSKKLGFEDAPFLDFDDSESLDQIKDFNTDDGDGITTLMGAGADAVKNAASSAGQKAVALGRVAKEKAGDVAEQARAKIHRTKYHYSIQGVVSEPVSFSELEDLLKKGKITEKTNVIETDGKEWKKLSFLISSTKDTLPPPPPEDDIPPPPPEE